jgi:hypothetical protein
MGNEPMRVAIVVPLLLLATPVFAQTPADLMACVRTTSDAERLACYDRAMAKASPEARAASDKRAAEAAVVAAAAAKTKAEADSRAAKAKADADAVAQQDAFGAEAVASRKDRYAPPAGEVQTIESTITELFTNTSGLGVFLLENGQLWKQVDTGRVPNVRVGDRISISRSGIGGGYHLNFLKQKSWVLVKRVR